MAATKKRMDNKKASEAAFDHLERARRRDYTVGNPDEMAAASKVTLSHNRPKDNEELFAPSPDAWELPDVDAAPREEGQDDPLQESFSSFGQGFYGDIGDEGFEASHQPMTEYADDLSFDQPDSFRPEAYQPGDFSDDDLFKFDQPETMGDDRMSYPAQETYAEPYEGFETYGTDAYESADAYEPMDAYESAEPSNVGPNDGYIPSDQLMGGEAPRSRRSRK